MFVPKRGGCFKPGTNTCSLLVKGYENEVNKKWSKESIKSDFVPRPGYFTDWMQGCLSNEFIFTAVRGIRACRFELPGPDSLQD